MQGFLTQWIVVVARWLLTGCACLGAGLACASTDRPPAGQASAVDPAQAAQAAQARAARHVDEATAVVTKMAALAPERDLLREARGVFIVPRYGRAALGVGAAGGAGVLVVKQAGGGWGGPAFYDLGALSAGAQAGGEGGAVVLALLNETAVNRFMQKTAFALTAGVGLTLIDWSRRRQGAIGDGDVVIWSAGRGRPGAPDWRKRRERIAAGDGAASLTDCMGRRPGVHGGVPSQPARRRRSWVYCCYHGNCMTLKLGNLWNNETLVFVTDLRQSNVTCKVALLRRLHGKMTVCRCGAGGYV